MRAPYFPPGLDLDHLRDGGLAIDAMLTALAEVQHQSVATRQLVALGRDPDLLRPRVRSGQLTRHRRGLFLLGRETPSRGAERLMAVHVGGAGTVLSELSAAAHRGAPVHDPSRIRVIVPPGGRIRDPGVAARDAVVLDEEREHVDGVPVLAWPRLLLDIAAYRPPHVLAHVWHDCVYRKLLDLGAVDDVLGVHRGEPGTVALRALAERRRVAIGASRNKLEADLCDIAVAAGLPEPRRNARLTVDGATLRPDAYIPERALAIETDGKDGHADPEQQADDAARDALYRRLGLNPVRYAWWPVTYQPAAVQEDFVRYARWWHPGRGLAAPSLLAGMFRLARRSTFRVGEWAA